MRAVLKICCSTAFVMLAWGQEPARTNPFDTPDGLQQGKALFQLHCSYCHGATGEGGRARRPHDRSIPARRLGCGSLVIRSTMGYPARRCRPCAPPTMKCGKWPHSSSPSEAARCAKSRREMWQPEKPCMKAKAVAATHRPRRRKPWTGPQRRRAQARPEVPGGVDRKSRCGCAHQVPAPWRCLPRAGRGSRASAQRGRYFHPAAGCAGQLAVVPEGEPPRATTR